MDKRVKGKEPVAPATKGNRSDLDQKAWELENEMLIRAAEGGR